MTYQEFKCWLEGYEESFVNGIPNKEQFTKIKEKLALVYQPIQTIPYPIYPYPVYPPFTYPIITCETDTTDHITFTDTTQQ